MIEMFAPLIFSVLYGLLFHYGIAESDIFWQIRAGEEILKNGAIQTVDTWSFTARGQPWFNFQWLATVVEYLVSLLGSDYYFIPTLRAVLVALMSGLITIWLQIALSLRPPNQLRLIWCLTPLLIFVCDGRFQMRPELFTLPLYLLLLITLGSQFKLKAKVLTSFGILVLWANFHNALAPLGVICFLVWLWAGHRPILKLSTLLGITLLAIVSLLATPLGWQGLYGLWMHLTTYRWEEIQNPDQAPLSWTFTFSAETARKILFLGSSVFSIFFYSSQRKTLKEFPRLYGQPLFVLTLGSILIFGALLRARIMPYAAIFLFPLFSVLISKIFLWSSSHLRPMIRVSLLAGLSLSIIATQVSEAYLGGYGFSFGVMPDHFPAASVNFILREKISGNIFNDYGFGGYIIDRLRSNLVALDGREIPFLDYMKLINRTSLMGTADAFQKLFDQEDVEILFLSTQIPQQFGIYTRMAPANQWALVYFDSVSLIYVKRTPKYAALIQQQEFRFLNPSKDPHWLLTQEGRIRKDLKQEINRCLSQGQAQTYCSWIMANLKPEY